MNETGQGLEDIKTTEGKALAEQPSGMTAIGATRGGETMSKLADLVHYICYKCDDPATLGATKLNKIPWFVDTITYLRDGRSLTGATYTKQQYGPVAKDMLRILRDLQSQGKIVSREPSAAYQPREFFAIVPPDASVFSDQDRALIDSAIEVVCREHTASSISKASHNLIWDAAAFGEEIPIWTVLASRTGELTDEDLTWASSVVDRVAESQAAPA